ncbi:MAG: hypothetical protein CMQ41_00275 [Gammaproteobacteria bacterium]|nr:hypothetical protein [Gammaproteobacteria bacterium]
MKSPKFSHIAICAALCISLANFVNGAENRLTISRIEGEPILADFSGMQPSSSLARSMTKVEGFIQREPYPGQRSEQSTEVYIGYNESNLYVVFLAFDNNPELIRSNLSPRENMFEDDHVGFIVDTFNDQRSAFGFYSNSRGIQSDSRWTESSSRRGGFDLTFDAVWFSEGELTDQGYMVSFIVPLRSLRFNEADEQTWRIQFNRSIPRYGEESHWPEYSIDVEGRLNQAAPLVGIRDVSPGNNYQVIPFFFARELDALDKNAFGGPKFDRSSEQEVGLDAKFVFNDSWALDLTLNPDFSQIESDEPQVTVNERFEVQFPERRPFFIENADFFATDSTLVFTRRIVDPEGGIRLTGRSGEYGFGGILINDAAPGLNREANDPLRGEKANIAIIRGFRDLGEQDRVGFLATERQLGDGYNRVLSLDGRFKFNENWSTQMQLIGTESEPSAGGDEVFGYQRNIMINREGRTYTNHTHFIETTSDFKTELGFQNRWSKPNTSGVHQSSGLNFYPENSTLNRWGGSVFGVYLENQQGQKIYTQLQPTLDLRFETTELEFRWTDMEEILIPGDFPGLNTIRSYHYDNWQVSLDNNTLESLQVSANYRYGTALNLVPKAGYLPSVADTSRIDLNVLVRPFDQLSIDNTYFLTELETKSGAKVFSNEIIRSNWNYQFTKELSLRFITQYDKTEAGPATRLKDEENLNFDILLRYVINPWSAFYIGYNSNQSNFDIVEFEGEKELITANDLRRDGDQFFVKFSYLFQR